MQSKITTLLFISILLWFCSPLNGQTTIIESNTILQSQQNQGRVTALSPPVIKDKRCASVEMHNWRQAKDPTIQSDQQFESWLAAEVQKRKKNNAKNVVITIPIIFHLIHPNQAPGTGDNIGANYVNAQIVQLNNDFRKIAGTSGDNNNPVGADTEIEFCPAEIDPQGNTLAEPGINRVSTSSQGFTNPPYNTGYVDGTIKPTTIWNPNDYCNVWVCRLSGGILGYAQFPSNSGLPGMPANGGGANTDGVVCTSTSIGSTTLPFPGGAPYNQGRTLTHEIGHWVGLRHIWGDGGCGVDDFCADTPTSDASNFGCPNGHTSCGTVDQIENYMDYTDDDCMNIFTLDQKTRIQTVMSLSPRRSTLGNSTACSNACGSLTIATNATPSDCNDNGTAGVTVNGATPPITYIWNTGATNPTLNNLPPGIYTVTVADGTGCSLVESAEVLSTCTEVCDTLKNFIAGLHTESLDASNISGYLTGHNNYGDIAKADYFDYAGGVHSHIKGAYLEIGIVTAGSNLSTFNVSVWAGNAAGPQGAPIFQMPVTYASMQTLFAANGNQPFLHYFEFPNFVAMPAGKQFYVGIDFIYGAGDLIAITHTANGQVIPSTAWEQHSDNTWHSFTEFPVSWGYNVAMKIWPVIGTPATVNITPLNPSVCENVGINFNCSGSNLTDQEWIFPGGTPAGSTNPSVTVTYGVPGSYTVYHIARNDCMIDTTELVNYVTINQCGCNVNPTTSFTEPNCNAGCDGTATVTPGSGVPPYTYVWDGAAAGQSTGTATGLCQGVYNATATDANGCYSIVSITITEPMGMIATANVITDVSCGGGSDGSASASANGGVNPYIYDWSSGEMTQTAVNLQAGMQTVTITDANGCTVLDTVTLTEPIPITVTTAVGQQPTCGQSNGVVSVQGSGGMPPLSYLWNNGQTTTTLIGLAAGTYTVTVTDNMGCTMVGSLTLTSPGGVSGATNVLQNISCNGGSDGSATVNTSGGTLPITYNWGTIPPQATQVATGLPFGNTSVTITDATGCNQVLTVTITQPDGVIGSAMVVSNGSCSGQNDGVATASASGGTPGYTYLWNDPANTTSATVSNLAPGAWMVTITDTNGCTGTAIVNVNNVPGVSANAQTTSNVSCGGGADGQTAVNATGGTPGFTYLWNDAGAQTTQTATGLMAGTYIVTVTDSNGCTATSQATVSEPGIINVTVITVQDANCGVANGALQCAAGGGAGGFSYIWSNTPPSTTPNLFGVPAGSYTVTVTDFSGCTQTALGIVGTIGGPVLTTSSTVETCNQGNGTATVTGAGGATPYVYQWDAAAANQTTQTAINLGSGMYSVSVTDGNGCVVVTTATVSDNCGSCNITVSTTTNNESCNGLCNGDATANPAGGTAPYTFNWDTGQNGSTATGLCAGVFTFTITDAANCSQTGSVTINGPTAITITTSSTNPSCGSANGSIAASAIGGTPGYSYNWNNGQMTQTAINLAAGTYMVTVTDSNGCTSTNSATISSPGGPTATVSGTNATCGANNGSATANANGGSAPYTYIWSANANGQTTQTAINLVAGTYTVTVTDSNQCPVVETVTITSTGGPTATVSGTNATCGANNGSATATPNGGSAPYTYIWSTNANGQTTQTAINLVAGTYTVTVTDSNQCPVVETVIITSTGGPTATVSGTNATCGVNNGSATATPNGGSAPYTYIWSANANGQMTQTAINLVAGTYTVTVTDSNQCPVVETVTITSSGGPSATVTGTNATCGANNGSATATPSGGSGPYTYNWSANANGQTTQTAINLVAGTYTVTVTDSNQCPVVETITITSIGGPSATVTSSNATCGNNNGSATATPSGGSGPYSYNWSANANGQMTQTAINLGAGTYIVTVTDNNNCPVVETVTVSSTAGPTGTVSTTNATCGNNNGMATANPMGGAGPYSYNWSANANGQTTQIASGLGAGTFTVTITDTNNCTIVTSGNVSGTGGPIVTVSITNSTCGSNNGSATATPQGGTGPFTYNWSANANGQTTQTALALVAGTYTVTVTDANNCITVENTTITTSSIPTATISTTSSTCGNNNGTATITPSGGTPGYTYLWSNAQTGQTASNLAAGPYSVTMVDINNCSVVSTLVVSNIDGPTATITSTGATCAGSDGTATATPTGGTLPYSYQWDANTGSQITQVANNLVPGIYSVTVSDGNGCTVVQQILVADVCVCNLAVTGVATNTTCAGNDGSATVTASGAPPYTYQWDAAAGGQITPTASALGIGVYSVTVSDSNGCDVTTSLAVADGCVCNVMATITANNTTCAGNDGSATANPMGGATPYTYQWNAAAGSQTTQTATALNIGGYSVTITDAIGCSIVQQVTILDGCVCNVSAFVTVMNTTCAGSDGSAMATPTGGTTPYTYQWDVNANNQTTQTAVNLTVGAYVVTITDANGCATINQIAVLDGCVCNMVGTISSTPTTCAANDGTGTVNVTGGLAPFTYLWDAAAGGQNTQTAIGLIVGGYVVTVTDANGCTVVQQVTVANGCVCTVQGTTSATSESCFGNDGTATVVAVGGNAPYTYLWDVLAGNQTTPTAIGLTAGNYSVVITDVFGCNVTVLVSVVNSCNCNIAVSIATTGTVCGDASGSATVNAAGGVPPFTFQWNNGAVTQTINSILAGTYTVTVTDSGGCSQVQTTNVTDGGNIAAQVATSDLSCNGDNTGSATVTNAGNFSYLWSTGQNTATINGLPAGSYSVTVSSGTCSDVVTVIVNEPGVLVATVQSGDSQCSANGGTASAITAGGTAPYSYLWNTGETMPSIGGLASGIYTVTITDTNGCETVGSGTVTSVANGPSLSALQTNITCSGSNDGTIDLTVNSGTAPFTYDWNGLNVEDLSGLAPGNYTCVVTDANNCTAVITVSITEPSPMTVSWYWTPPGPTNDMGTAAANVIGGTPSYSYIWSNGQTTQLATGLAAGTYTVDIIDANGCVVSDTVTIWNPTAVDEIESLTLFELYPNPSNGIFTVNLEFNAVEDVEFTIYTILGQQLMNVSMRGSSLFLPVDLSSYAAAGSYFVSVKSDDGGEVVKRFIITD